MKRPALAAIVLGLVLAVTPLSQAQGSSARSSFQPEFYVKPSFMYSFGETEYVMDIAVPDDQLGVLRLKSQLEFPLDAAYGGGAAGMYLSRHGRKVWRFEAGFWTSFTDPGGTMYDHDWWNLRTGTFEKFSYTESAVEMKAILFRVEVAREIYTGTNYGLSLFVGFRHHKIEQDVIGFTGWQIVDDAGTVVQVDAPGLLGIVYDVTYNLPHAGVMLTYDLGRTAEFATKAAYSIVMVSDVDDHVLRGKIAESDITGNGLLGGANLRFNIGPPRRSQLFLDLGGEFYYLRASGSQVQRWYADEVIIDPDTNQEIVITEAGTVIPGIPHDINKTAFHVGASVGIEF